MTRFSTFALLYMTAIYLDFSEKWPYPTATLAVLLFATVLVATGITPVRFLLFLAATTAHFLLVQFPEVPNHVNVAVYIFALMLTGIGYSLVHRSRYPTDDDAFELLRPLLQISMILLYAIAGFHKLNRDFFDPAVSCVADLMEDMVRMSGGRVIRLPTTVVLLTGILALANAVLSARYGRLGIGRRAAALGAVLAGSVVAFAAASYLLPRVWVAAVLAMSVVIILWEVVGGPLLAVPRFQAPVLAFSWSLHATLVLIGFVDFGAVALAMLFTFVPQNYWVLLSTPVRLPGTQLRVSRAKVYFAICVVVGLVSGLERRFLGAILFEIAAMVFLWPVVAAAVGRGPRPVWGGVPITAARTPAWLFVFPVLLVIHGFTSYLGLRTAGNFSMFSNLRTEGPVSNHLLLSGNPLKLWGYQEDVVRFIAIDDERAEIGFKYQPLQGNALPVVEFRKLIRKWTRAGMSVPMTIEYWGQVYRTDDITRDPHWRFQGTDWEMRLLDFRVIQGGGANGCRW